MPDVALDRADETGLVGVTTGAHERTQRGQLDGVPARRARPVGLDVLHAAR